MSLFLPGIALMVLLIFLSTAGCRPSVRNLERVFRELPKQNYDSIECSDLLVTRELLGLAAISSRSSLDDKLAYFSRMRPFTFSAEEYSFLVSDKAPLGFDPSDFFITVVARTPSYSVTVVWGDFDSKIIRERLLSAGYREEIYHGHAVYSLPWSDASTEGGLGLTFANLTFAKDDIIASAPTEQLLKDYLDRIEVGTLDEDRTMRTLVEELAGESSFYISRAVRTDELYGDESLFVRTPEDSGLVGYRLSPYTYFAFGIRPAADNVHQHLTLMILYPDKTSAKKDVSTLSNGLNKGKSLSRLVPFSDLMTVTDIISEGALLTVSLDSKDDFDVKLLLRLRDLPFLAY